MRNLLSKTRRDARNRWNSSNSLVTLPWKMVNLAIKSFLKILSSFNLSFNQRSHLLVTMCTSAKKRRSIERNIQTRKLSMS